MIKKIYIKNFHKIINDVNIYYGYINIFKKKLISYNIHFNNIFSKQLVLHLFFNI